MGLQEVHRILLQTKPAHECFERVLSCCIMWNLIILINLEKARWCNRVTILHCIIMHSTVISLFTFAGMKMKTLKNGATFVLTLFQIHMISVEHIRCYAGFLYSFINTMKVDNEFTTCQAPKDNINIIYKRPLDIKLQHKCNSHSILLTSFD